MRVEAGVLIARGLAASGGVAEGVLALSAADALGRVAQGQRVVLVLRDFDPEDAPAVRASVALVTVVGGLTSDGAIVARVLGIPCVTGCGGLSPTAADEALLAQGEGPTVTIPAGARLRVDGGAGRVEHLPETDQ